MTVSGASLQKGLKTILDAREIENLFCTWASRSLAFLFSNPAKNHVTSACFKGGSLTKSIPISFPGYQHKQFRVIYTF